MTSKYDALAAHLDARDAPGVTLTFVEVEAVVGSLPRPAWRAPGWWVVGGTHFREPHAFRWREACWVAARPDFGARTVTFRRLVRP